MRQGPKKYHVIMDFWIDDPNAVSIHTDEEGVQIRTKVEYNENKEEIIPP